MIQKDKTYLVTGATGTIGKNLCGKILSLGANVIALSRNRWNISFGSIGIWISIR